MPKLQSFFGHHRKVPASRTRFPEGSESLLTVGCEIREIPDRRRKVPGLSPSAPPGYRSSGLLSDESSPGQINATVGLSIGRTEETRRCRDWPRVPKAARRGRPPRGVDGFVVDFFREYGVLEERAELSSRHLRASWELAVARPVGRSALADGSRPETSGGPVRMGPSQCVVSWAIEGEGGGHVGLQGPAER